MDEMLHTSFLEGKPNIVLIVYNGTIQNQGIFQTKMGIISIATHRYLLSMHVWNARATIVSTQFYVFARLTMVFKRCLDDTLDGIANTTNLDNFNSNDGRI
jgi:hypothetical protein